MANYAHNKAQWAGEDTKFLVDLLLRQIPEEQPLSCLLLVDIKTQLYPDVKREFLDPDGKGSQTLGAVKAFAEDALDDIGRITGVAAAARMGQF